MQLTFIALPWPRSIVIDFNPSTGQDDKLRLCTLFIIRINNNKTFDRLAVWRQLSKYVWNVEYN